MPSSDFWQHFMKAAAMAANPQVYLAKQAADQHSAEFAQHVKEHETQVKLELQKLKDSEEGRKFLQRLEEQRDKRAQDAQDFQKEQAKHQATHEIVQSVAHGLMRAKVPGATGVNTTGVNLPGMPALPPEMTQPSPDAGRPTIEDQGQSYVSTTPEEQAETANKAAMASKEAQWKQQGEDMDKFFQANPNLEKAHPGIRESILLHSRFGWTPPEPHQQTVEEQVYKNLSDPKIPQEQKTASMRIWRGLHPIQPQVALMNFQSNQTAEAHAGRVTREAMATLGAKYGGNMNNIPKTELQKEIQRRIMMDPQIPDALRDPASVHAMKSFEPDPKAGDDPMKEIFRKLLTPATPGGAPPPQQ